MDRKVIRVALAGNPNSGKTTVFNCLTGARQHVGNYPGVTVDKKEGWCCYKGYEIQFVDLPGTYSLTAYSIEEIVARDYIVSESPDVVVSVVDSSNLERNLYLTTQLLELNVPMVIALNMSDVAKKLGYSFDIDTISRFFNAATVSTVGSKGKGIEDLLEAIIAKTHENHEGHLENVNVNYGDDIEKEIQKITKHLDGEHELVNKYGRRWLSLKLLEQDKEIIKQNHSDKVHKATEQGIENIVKLYGDNPEILAAEKRYGFVSGVYEQAVQQTVQRRHQFSDIVDMVLLNRFLGIPIFLFMMFLAFKLTFTVGEPFMELIQIGFNWLGGFISGFWEPGSESMLRSLLVDGIIGGVGGVVVFLPNIILLFLAIAILEDTGYMARAAFLMDRIMKKVGLHGRSFIPMMIGFGCSVPAIMGTRILDDRKSRFATIMILPLMSCGARLPIYALIIPAFFEEELHAYMMLLIYVIGVCLAIFLAWVLRKTLLKGETGIFLMELPPYRMPTIRGLVIHMWERSWLYLKKAGTIILALSIVLWALTSFPKADDSMTAGLDEAQAAKMQLDNSIAGQIGNAMEPVISTMGFDEKIGTALIGALAAKEVFVAQMGIVFSISDIEENTKSLADKLKDNYSPLVGFCIMLFCLISAPCMATVAVSRRETGSWKWALFQFASLTLLAYIITTAVYQIGSFFF